MRCKISELSFSDSALESSAVVTPGGRKIYRYKFASAQDLERAFVENFDALKDGGYSSKAIVDVLLVFKYEKRA